MWCYSEIAVYASFFLVSISRRQADSTLSKFRLLIMNGPYV